MPGVKDYEHNHDSKYSMEQCWDKYTDETCTTLTTVLAKSERTKANRNFTEYVANIVYLELKL